MHSTANPWNLNDCPERDKPQKNQDVCNRKLDIGSIGPHDAETTEDDERPLDDGVRDQQEDGFSAAGRFSPLKQGLQEATCPVQVVLGKEAKSLQQAMTHGLRVAAHQNQQEQARNRQGP